MNRQQSIENSIIKKYRKKLWSPFMKTVREFELVKENDKIAVCISGGKDSMLLAKCLEELKKHGDVSFELVYLVMNPGYQEENLSKIKENLNILGLDATIFESNIFEVADESSKRRNDNPCYLCARMRRGALYHKAQELGCNKIALGHHMNDVIETVLLNLIWNGQVSSMMPKLHSDNFEGMELIRPLYYVKEKYIISWARFHELSFIDCACSVTKKGIGKRAVVKKLVDELCELHDDADLNILTATKNINLNTLLGYQLGTQKYSFMEKYDKD
ncbi:MAG: tRNA 2-thiocytidine biosynthesis protein TtcA [Firmicutes bacterium]|nr:tRNA 2-thiocytidine biosynthesis protein TtcA [Bacillota bacterium]